MRKLLAVTIVLGSAAAAWMGIGALDAQGKSFKLRIAASKGKAAANLPVFIGSESAALGATSSAGELELAFDSSKNGKTFNVYRERCSRIVMYEAKSPEDRKCEQESSASSVDECKGCRPLGLFVFGKDATVGEFGGGNTTRNVVLVGVAGATTAGVLAARGGNGTAPAQPPFMGVSGTYQLNNLTGNGGCLGFTATAMATLTLSIDPTTGLGTASVQYNGSRTDYSNARAVREGNRHVITGTGATVLTPTRNFTADVRAEVEQTQIRGFRENFMQTTGTGSPCTQTYSQ